MTIKTVKRMWPVIKHLTFGVVIATCWVVFAVVNEGLWPNVLAVLGSMQLGAHLLEKWPTTN